MKGLSEFASIFEQITGVSVDQTIEASGDPIREADLLMEIGENAKPKDILSVFCEELRREQ